MSTPQPNLIRQSSIPGQALGDYSDQTPGDPPGARAVSAVINALPWVADTEYLANQLVTNGGTTYIANFAHTSASDFDTDAFNWTAIGSTSGGGTPTGPAGGDLSGTYPDPAVAQIAGMPVLTGAGSPTGVVPPQLGAMYIDTTPGNGGVYFALGDGVSPTGVWMQVAGPYDPTAPGLSNIGGDIELVNPNGHVAIQDGIAVTIGDGVKILTPVAFNGGAPVAAPTITGALSTVTDPAAKDVLTSIVAALAAAGVNLVVDGTT